MLQLNRAKFSANGNCGYVLKPQCMCQGEGPGHPGRGTGTGLYGRGPAGTCALAFPGAALLLLLRHLGVLPGFLRATLAAPIPSWRLSHPRSQPAHASLPCHRDRPPTPPHRRVALPTCSALRSLM